MNKRNSWVDQLKGLAVGLGAVLYLLPMILTDFNPQNTAISSTVEFIRSLKFYLPLGLVLISGFSLYFNDDFTPMWWRRKFTALVLLSSWFYLISQDESHYYYLMIPCLFVYYIAWYFLKNTSIVEKTIINIILGTSYFIGLKLSPSLINMPIGGSSLSDTAALQLFWFNLLSGLPMVILGSYLIPWINPKQLNHQRLNQAIIGLGLCLLIDYVLHYYFLTSPVTSGYPPMLRQTWSGALVVLVAIKALNMNNSPLSALTALGRHSLMNFWALWLFGTLIISWNNLGKHQFNLPFGLGLICLILMGYGIIKSKLPKSGINLEE